jgi:hypothetical protein
MLRRRADSACVDDRVDHDDLVALLERYDGAISDGPSKIGPGLDSFFRRRNVGEGYSAPGFWVRRVDGTETDIASQRLCAASRRPGSKSFRMLATMPSRRTSLRRSEPISRNIATRTGSFRGPYRRAHLSSRRHVDHACPTFGQLVVSFRAANGWQQEMPAALTTPSDAQSTALFVAPEVAERFRSFHHSAAALRVIARRRNLSMAAGQRRPRVRRPVILP